MYRYLTVIIMLAGFAAVFGQTKIYTVEEALNAGLTHSDEINIAEAGLTGAKAGLDEVSSLFYPALSFNAGYARLSDIPPFRVDVPFAPQPITIQEPILDTYRFQLSVRQPVFTGFRLLSLKKAATYRKKAGEEKLDTEKNNKAMDIREAFWNFYRAKEVQKLVEKNIESVREHMRNTENFVKNGLAVKNDLLKLEVRKRESELRLVEAKNNVSLARAVFNKTIGININAESDISAATEHIGAGEYDISVLHEEAVKNRGELIAAEYGIKAGEEAVDAAESDWYPQVYAFGNFNYNRPNQRIMPAEDKFEDTWEAGVNLTWELWDWGNTSAKKQQAQAEVTISRSNRNILKKNIELQVYRYFFDYRSAKEKVEVARKGVESARESYRISSEEYNRQAETSAGLIDAETNLLKAETELTNALVELKLAEQRLLKSAGRKVY